MERQQFREYQQDLFTQRGEDSLCPSTTCEAVSVAEVVKALQVEQAGENGRALAQDLMGAVLCHSNISQAYKQVKRNKGVAGIDHMAVEDFAVWYSKNWETLFSNLAKGTYQPQAVKEVTIPKGLVFKGRGEWYVNGKLNVLGTSEEPVVFTTI